jgi:farnesyl diphosphate synthase
MRLSINDLLIQSQQRIEHMIRLYLRDTKSPSNLLKEAMYYALANGGKRIRPLLVYATGYYLDAPWESLDIPACAIEFIHSYSLIHDDLPAMDNADLRRGKPSCHKAFNEALAILAGDALQPLAFEIIASHPAPLNTERRISMIHHLCYASGLKGMAAGQALDIAGIHTIEKLIQMYALKTGALLSTSVKLGAIAGHLSHSDTLSKLEIFADAIGFAFQIQDDLLDIESNTETMGKPQGIDAINHKITYPALVGIEEARTKIQSLFATALSIIETLGEKAYILRELAYFLLQRKK